MDLIRNAGQRPVILAPPGGLGQKQGKSRHGQEAEFRFQRDSQVFFPILINFFHAVQLMTVPFVCE